MNPTESELVVVDPLIGTKLVSVRGESMESSSPLASWQCAVENNGVSCWVSALNWRCHLRMGLDIKATHMTKPWHSIICSHLIASDTHCS